MDSRRFLYHARIDRHLTLEEIRVRTALSPSVLRNLDEGRFERLPSGLYSRAYVRAFAAAVGLDPEHAVDQLEHLLPGAPDPLPVLSAKNPSVAERTWQAIRHACERGRAIAANSAALRDLLQTEVQRVQWSLRVTAGLSADLPALTTVGTERFVGPRAALLPRAQVNTPVVAHAEQRRRPSFVRYAAAFIDALALLVVEICVVMLTSQSTGVSLDHLLRDASPALAGFTAIPLLLYFLFFGGIAGTTPGRYVCQLGISDEHLDRVDHADRPLTLRAILRRTLD
jgi:hypothetical protein